MSDAVISVASLGKTYRDGLFWRRRRTVLRELTLDVRPGEIFGLLGPNGAGKTTFIKILLGIVRRTTGDAQLLGFPAGDRRGRRLVGYLPENLRIARHHDALSALDYYGRLSGLSSSEIRRRRGPLLETVGLADRTADGVGKYSKGMLQRLGLAQALLHDPQLVILDEPTDGLDPVGRSHVRAVMQRLKEQGKTVFVNSHILQEVELICDRVAILDRGDLRYVGPVQQIVSSGGAATGAASTGGAAAMATFELQLELVGDAAAVRTALEPATPAAWDSSPDGRHRLTIRLADQTDVDRLIDRLRREAISIVQLIRRRLSLEDAFLAILAAPSSESPDRSRP